MRQKPFKGENAYIYGEMAEWSKAHDWKSCVRHKRTMGSNPIFSAKRNLIRTQIRVRLFFYSNYFKNFFIRADFYQDKHTP